MQAPGVTPSHHVLEEEDAVITVTVVTDCRVRLLSIAKYQDFDMCLFVASDNSECVLTQVKTRSRLHHDVRGSQILVARRYH